MTTTKSARHSCSCTNAFFFGCSFFSLIGSIMCLIASGNDPDNTAYTWGTAALFICFIMSSLIPAAPWLRQTINRFFQQDGSYQPLLAAPHARATKPVPAEGSMPMTACAAAKSHPGARAVDADMPAVNLTPSFDAEAIKELLDKEKAIKELLDKYAASGKDKVRATLTDKE